MSESRRESADYRDRDHHRAGMQIEGPALAEACAGECCAPPPLALPTRRAVDRAALIRAAFRLEWLTIGWMMIEAVVALVAGIGTGSLILVAFGLDSVIELISAGVLMWRLSTELRRGQAFSNRLSGSRAGSVAYC